MKTSALSVTTNVRPIEQYKEEDRKYVFYSAIRSATESIATTIGLCGYGSGHYGWLYFRDILMTDESFAILHNSSEFRYGIHLINEMIDYMRTRYTTKETSNNNDKCEPKDFKYGELPRSAEDADDNERDFYKYIDTIPRRILGINANDEPVNLKKNHDAFVRIREAFNTVSVGDGYGELDWEHHIELSYKLDVIILSQAFLLRHL